MDVDFSKFTGRKKKLWEIRMKMVRFSDTFKSRLKCHSIGRIYLAIPCYFLFNSLSKKLQNKAKKANQTDIVAEKKRMEPPQASRGISKQKWLEERKKRIGKLLDANGLDMKNAYMLDTQEMAETKYKKWEKDPAPYGWDGMLQDLCSLIIISFIVFV